MLKMDTIRKKNKNKKKKNKKKKDNNNNNRKKKKKTIYSSNFMGKTNTADFICHDHFMQTILSGLLRCSTSVTLPVLLCVRCGHYGRKGQSEGII